MKIYFTREVTSRDLYRASSAAHMVTENERWHGSRYADIATVVEFNGYGFADVHSARRPNDRGRSGGAWYAATWDQWGVLLGGLLRLDPDAKIGGYKRPYYDGAMDFQWQTNGRFVQIGGGWPTSHPLDFHGDHRWKFDGVRRSDGARIFRCTKCTAAKVYR